jgi:hypothetical protein
MAALQGNNLSEAYAPTTLKAGEERSENPQAYDQFLNAFQHKKEARHILGLVGGNEVSGINGNRVDLESDLLGITRPITWGNSREHLPPHMKDTTIERKNPKSNLQIDITPVHLKTYQMWAYPATFAPPPFVKETCGRPEKY